MKPRRIKLKRRKVVRERGRVFAARRSLLIGGLLLLGLLVPILAFSFTPAQEGVPHTTICEGCHDGTVDGSPDVMTDFGETSAHPLDPDPTSGCLECHNAPGDLDGFGKFYPRLLRALDPSATFQYTGNAYCGACHGEASSTPNGDLLSQFTGTPHDTDTPAPESGTGVKCNSCHTPHGSGVTPLLLELVDGNAVTGNDNTQCFACHAAAAGTFPGETAYNNTEHGSDSIAENIWPISGDAGFTTGGTSSGDCINCHNPHGKDDGGSPTTKYTHRNEEGLCFGGNPASGDCHAGVSGSENGINMYERFTAGDGVVTPPELSRHSIGDVDQGAAGSKVECANCHNSHLDSQANKITDPDDLASSFTDTMDDPNLFPTAVIQPGPNDGKDALIASGFPTLNFGSVPTSFQIGYVDAGSYEKSRGLYQFDLSVIPAGATITSATFNLYQNGLANGTDLTIDLHQVTSSWSEGTVNWNTQPSFSATPEVSLVLDNTINLWRTWDVTSLVDDWHNGVVTNNGMVLIAPDAEAGVVDWYRVFFTSERALNATITGEIAVRPKLIVQFTPAPQVTDSIGFCGSCHDASPPAGVTVPAATRQIIPDYTRVDGQGDYHGSKAGVLDFGETSEGDIIGPYYAGMPPMACEDCHDPHGSGSVYTIREEVNGKTGISITADNGLSATKTATRAFCTACHLFYHVPTEGCFECHFHGANTDADVNTVF